MSAEAQVCQGCFAHKGNASLCPHCGYDERAPLSSRVLPPGTMLQGEYRIGRVLGEPGGFGITYLAFDIMLATRVAIKEYLPAGHAERSRDGQAVVSSSPGDSGLFQFGLRQFLEEARIVASLNHGSLVRVRRYFEENGTGYLVMDYYQGMSLDAWLKRQPGGRVNESLARGIMLPILDGLREVHGKGILHRDIKPANIYLADLKRPILLDFGAARVAMGERSRSLSVVLTPGYAPYEQYHRKGVQGPWTDVYGCAAVLYRMVAGFAPPEAAERIVEDELQALASVVPGVSAGFSAAVQQGLSMQQADRPQSVEAFQHLLEGVGPRPRQAEQRTAEDRPEPGPGMVAEPKGDAREKEKSPAPSGKPPSFILLALIVCLLAAGLGVFAYNRYQGQVQEQAASRQAEEKRQEALAAQRLAEEQRMAAARAAEEQRRQEAAARLAEAERLKKEGPYGKVFTEQSAGVAMDFVWVPGGCFWMGSPDGSGERIDRSGKKAPDPRSKEEGRYNSEGPVHEVCVDGFYMGKTEVTNSQYRQFQSGYDFGDYEGESLNGGNQPVVGVSAKQADAYAEWLSGRSGKAYRLPSEAQWEYAARGNTETAYFWGGSAAAACGYANGADMTAKRKWSDWPVHDCEDGYAASAPVGSFSANGFGLQDMLGNVWEWTADCWHDNYRGAPVDGTAWMAGDCDFRVFRGGSWGNDPRLLRSAYRDRYAPGFANNGLGFRLVLPVH